MAEIWAFVGWEHQATQCLQQLSHRSRAYLQNAGGLKGFLVKADVTRIIKQAIHTREIEQVTRWQHIDLPRLFIRLRELTS